MKELDKFERIVADAEYAVAVLMNRNTHDTQFVELQPLAGDTVRAYTERGLCFACVIGTVAGEVRMATAVELDSDTVEAVKRAFVGYVRKNRRWTVRPDMNAN